MANDSTRALVSLSFICFVLGCGDPEYKGSDSGDAATPTDTSLGSDSNATNATGAGTNGNSDSTSPSDTETSSAIITEGRNSDSVSDSVTTTENETDVGTDHESGANSDLDSDTNIELATDTHVDVGTDLGTEIESDTGSDEGTDSDNATQSDTMLTSDTGTGSNFGTDTAVVGCQDDGSCPSCHVCNASSECIPADYNSDPKNDCSGTQPEQCGHTGVCDGVGHCEYYGVDTVCDDGDPSTLGDHCDGSGGCASTPYCDNHSCWQVPPTGMDICYSDDAVIDCVTCDSDGMPEFCGQDPAYTGTQRTFDISVIDGDAVVTDSVTGLIWQQTHGSGMLSYINALSYCAGLDYADETDWRLPNYHELFSIVEWGNEQPSIDTTAFPNTDDTGFIASRGDDYGWAISFEFGWSTYLTGGDAARCVRGPSIGIEENDPDRFYVSTISGDEVVLDRATGQEWQKSFADGLTRKNALIYCESSDYAGYTDWRLPTINELLNLVNTNADNTSLFPDMPEEGFWPSTAGGGAPNLENWVVYFNYGDVDVSYNETDLRYVRCVR